MSVRTTADQGIINNRSRYYRTSGDMLLNDDKVGPVIWWNGSDAGGGHRAIGPNGPWTAQGGGNPAVTRATALITDPLAQVPWVLHSPGSPHLTEPPRWLSDPMLTRSDDRIGPQAFPHVLRLSRAAFWANWVRQALWWGMGVVAYVEDETGQPRAGSMYLLHRYGFDVCGGHGQGPVRLRIGNEYETDQDGRFTAGGVRWRTLILRHPNSPVDDQGRSFGVFEMHPDTFQMQAEMSAYQSNTFRTGVPSGYIKVNQPGLTQNQADEIKSKWMTAHNGDARSVAVLNATTEYAALSMSPVDTALVDLRRASLVDIANAFGLDPNMLGGPSGDSATYANVESRYSHYRVHTLGRWQTDIEEAVSPLLPGGSSVEVALAGLLRADTSSRFDQYTKALAAGWLTVDEVRASEGLEPLPKVATPAPTPEAPTEAPEGLDDGTEEGTEDD